MLLMHLEWGKGWREQRSVLTRRLSTLRRLLPQSWWEVAFLGTQGSLHPCCGVFLWEHLQRMDGILVASLPIELSKRTMTDWPIRNVPVIFILQRKRLRSSIFSESQKKRKRKTQSVDCGHQFWNDRPSQLCKMTADAFTSYSASKGCCSSGGLYRICPALPQNRT